MSCWFANRDTITENTFAGNEREALAVIDGSEPRVERNVFFGHPKAIACSFTRSEQAAAGVVAKPMLRENLFWKNDANFSRGNPKPDAKRNPWRRPARSGDGERNGRSSVRECRGGRFLAGTRFARTARGDRPVQASSCQPLAAPAGRAGDHSRGPVARQRPVEEARCKATAAQAGCGAASSCRAPLSRRRRRADPDHRERWLPRAIRP